MNKLRYVVTLGLFLLMLICISTKGATAYTVYKITHYGNVGAIVFFQVVAPVDAKIGESFSVDIKFTINEEIEASSFFIWIHGAGISWEEKIASMEVGVGPKNVSGIISRNVVVTATIMEAVWCDITLGFRQVQYIGTPQENFYFGSSSFGICMPRSETYAELQTENSELSYNYTSLKNEYDTYRNAHSHSDSDYSALNSTYDQYKQGHSYSNNDYANLQSNYDNLNGELGIARTINYVLIAVAAVFGMSTVYFALRKPKPVST